jgi:hypothetical protein
MTILNEAWSMLPDSRRELKTKSSRDLPMGIRGIRKIKRRSIRNGKGVRAASQGRNASTTSSIAQSRSVADDEKSESRAATAVSHSDSAGDHQSHESAGGYSPARFLGKKIIDETA